MTKFTTRIHLIASTNDLDNDLVYLQRIMDVIYKNSAVLTRNWIPASIARKKVTPDIEKADWEKIVNESLDAIMRSDLIIAEITLADFNQGIQTYIAAQYKKPTLVLTRADIRNRFVSGISNKFLTLQQYATEEDLDSLIGTFIKKNRIPERDLRFNMVLDRRIVKYLREKSYETGENKSEIVRNILENEIKQKDDH